MTPVDSASAPGARTTAAPPPDAPRSAAEWGKEILSWASPDGLILHATQPLLAAGLRQSGAGNGTEWGPSLQRVLDDPRSVASFQAGMRQGVFEGAKSLVEGAWGLATGLAKASYNTSPLGWLVEGGQKLGIVGDVPGWVPDAGRVVDQASAVGKGIGSYIDAVRHDPAKLGNDVKGWIANNWNSLKADHAAAAAKGGAAEAEWWGKIAGRATFEVASLVVPVTKFATVAKAGETLNAAMKAGKLGETFAQAAQAGKLGELFAAGVKAGKTADLVSEARAAGRLPELAQAARTTPGGVAALAKEGGVTLGDVATLEKGGALTAADAAVARRTIATERLGEMLKTAPAAKAEVDALAGRIAGEYGGRVATAPVKSEARALEKIMADYGGDASRIKDLARNTIIVGEKDIPAVVKQLEAAGAKIKTVAATTDPLGYSGVNATIVTKSGLTAEIQVNTAKMIFAKEGAGNAQAILGGEAYDAIAREVGVEGGRGHQLYEQWRALPPDSPKAAAIAAESRAYYDRFR